MIHKEILDLHRQELLRKITLFISHDNFYLAGGTALSLQRGYRKSVDFDFFTEDKFDERELYLALKDEFSAAQHQAVGRGTCDTIIEGVQVSFFRYPYPVLHLVSGFPEYPDLQMAGIKDIACMKMEAVANRGAKKDFYDLYQIITETGYHAEDLMKLFQEKYGADADAIDFVARGLCYFEDARSQKFGDLYKPADWGTIEETMSKLSFELSSLIDREYRQGE